MINGIAHSTKRFFCMALKIKTARMSLFINAGGHCTRMFASLRSYVPFAPKMKKCNLVNSRILFFMGFFDFLYNYPCG
jgi:hypothetical protein